jgi:hypothetical protein
MEKKGEHPTKRNGANTEIIGEFQMLHPSLQDHNTKIYLIRRYDTTEEKLDLYWRQRSRVQWNEQGDRNTAYFHMIATQRRRRNIIVSVQNENGM